MGGLLSCAGISLPVFALLLWSWLEGTACFKVNIPPGKTECISETIDPEHFEVPGGARIEGAIFVTSANPHYAPAITIRVISPQGEQMWQQPHVQTETHFNIAARGPGTYKACFFNPWESRVEAIVDLVYFTLGHLRRPGATVNIPKGTQESRSKEVAQAGHLDDVKRTVTSMEELLQIVRGEQLYLQRKLSRHLKTVHSNNWRTLFYTGLEVFALVAACAFQVYSITRFFQNAVPKLSV